MINKLGAFCALLGLVSGTFAASPLSAIEQRVRVSFHSNLRFNTREKLIDLREVQFPAGNFSSATPTLRYCTQNTISQSQSTIFITTQNTNLTAMELSISDIGSMPLIISLVDLSSYFNLERWMPVPACHSCKKVFSMRWQKLHMELELC